MWKTPRLNCPRFTPSRKPISFSARNVGESSPARTSMTVTFEPLPIGSRIFIWSPTEFMSTISVASG